MKSSVKNDKLREAYGLYYPEMQEPVMEGSNEKGEMPDISDEMLHQFDEIFSHAQQFNVPLLITYYEDNRFLESIMLKFKYQQGYIELENGRKVRLSDIVDLKIV